MAQLCSKKADRKRLAARRDAGIETPLIRAEAGKRNSPIFNSKKNAFSRNAVRTLGVVILKSQ